MLQLSLASSPATAGRVCFLLVVLASIGLLLTAAGDVLIGLVFLRQAGSDDGPEFV
jgi:hypothetical protein